MKTLPVTVFSGFSGVGKTTVLNHVLNNCDGLRVAVILNSKGEVPPDTTQVAETAALNRTNEALVQLSNGCICCTLRQDLLTEVTTLARSGRFDYLLIESTGTSEPLPVAETFTHVDDHGESLSNYATLDTMVTVVDAKNFWNDYLSTEELRDRGIGIDDDDVRDIARLLVDQIEFANVILLNKTDLVSEEDAGRLVAVLRKLNPEARVISVEHGKVQLSDVINTGRFHIDWAESADALQHELLKDSGDSELDGITSFVYRARRPFHPQRFWDFWMEGDHGPHILRSKGYFWLATRNRMAGFWSQTGQVLAAEPGGAWWAETPREEWPKDEPLLLEELTDIWDEVWGDRRQELVIIGENLDQSAFVDDLDSCLLTDSEMQSGPKSWLNLEDPFGPWDIETVDLE